MNPSVSVAGRRRGRPQSHRASRVPENCLSQPAGHGGGESGSRLQVAPRERACALQQGMVNPGRPFHTPMLGMGAGAHPGFQARLVGPSDPPLLWQQGGCHANTSRASEHCPGVPSAWNDLPASATGLSPAPDRAFRPRPAPSWRQRTLLNSDLPPLAPPVPSLRPLALSSWGHRTSKSGSSLRARTVSCSTWRTGSVGRKGAWSGRKRRAEPGTCAPDPSEAYMQTRCK